jgi:hypothetical protein
MKRHLEVALASIVRVDISNVDRGTGDARSILAVVFKKKDNGFFK